MCVRVVVRDIEDHPYYCQIIDAATNVSDVFIVRCWQFASGKCLGDRFINKGRV